MGTRTSLTKCAVLAATGMAVVLTTPAFAADEDEIITVTARRIEENLQDVPISMTVYNQESLASRNIVNAADLATYTPSLSVNTRYGPEKAAFAIRGFVQDFATAPSVGVYFADVVGPRGSSTTTAGNGVTVGSLFDLQNVQVLKGPQGTLFGRNTTGGAVLLVPNRPTDKLEGYIEGSAGNYNMWRVQGVVNIPMSDTFKVRLGVDRMKRRGYLNNKSPVGPRHFNDSNYIAARLSVLAELTPTLENYTIASYTKSENNGTTFKVVACKRPDPTQPGNGWTGLQFLGGTFGCAQVDRQNARGDGWWDVENSHPNPSVKFTTWQVINTTKWEASDNITIKNIISYSEFTEDTFLQLGGDYWALPNGQPIFSSIQIDTTDGFHYGSQSGFTEELQIIGTHGRLNWQVGGFMEISNPLGYNSQTVPLLLNCTNPPQQCAQGFGFNIPGVGFVPVANLGRPFYQQRWRSYGIYAQGTYELADGLSLTGGIRHTWDSQRHYQASINIRYLQDNTPIAFCSNTINNPGPGGPGTTRFLTDPNDFRQCSLEFSTKSKAPTWVLDLSYKVVPDVMVYAKWSRGYRAGGVNTPFVGYETWDAEKVDTYEIGAKASFRGAVSGYFNVAGFYNDFRNQQIQATLTAKTGAPSTGGTAILNAGKSRIWGIEVDTAMTFFDSLRAEIGYTYLNTKLQALSGIPADDNVVWVPGTLPWRQVVPTARIGDPLAFSPRHRLQATLSYKLPLPESVGEVTIGGTYVHTAKQQSNIASPLGLLPSTDLLNLNVTWKDVAGQPFDLSFFMTNVTNEKFLLAAGGQFNSFGFDSGPINEPRMWGFRLKYKFGE